MSDDEIRLRVREWLQINNRKSYQLAAEIGIRPQTFYAQMSVRNISGNTKRALARIIPGLLPSAEMSMQPFQGKTDPVRLNIRKWLKAKGRTRQWLAEQCRVSVRTVHAWFTASGNIPATQSLFIDKLMKEDTTEPSLPNTFAIRFPETEMFIIRKFQKLHPGVDLTTYGMHKILELCINTLFQDEQAPFAPVPDYIGIPEDCRQAAE